MFLLSCLFVSILLIITPTRLLEEIPIGLTAWATAAITFVLFWKTRQAALRNRENPWTSVAPLTQGWIVARYGIGAVLMFYWDQYEWMVPGLERRYHVLPGREHLLTACVVALLGAIGVYTGFQIKVGGLVRMLPDLSWPVDQDKLQRNALLYAPFGLFVLLYLNPRLPIEIQFMVSLFATLTYALIVMISYWWFTARSGHRLQWALATLSICGVASMLGLLSGQVGQVFVPFMMVLLGYAAARRRLPWRVLIPIGLIAFLLLAPFLTVYKYSKYSMGIQDPSVGDRIDFTRESLDSMSYQAGVELAFDRFVGRMVLIEFPAVFSAYFPNSYEHVNGYSFMVELSSLVPRFLWPDKPQMSVELNRFSQQVGFVEEGNDTSAVFDAFAEYYVNFGYIGVFLLGALHALYLKVLYEWLTRSLDWLAGISIHLMVFLLNFDFFGVGQMFVSHIKLIPVAIIVIYVLGRQRAAEQAYYGARYART